MFFFFIKLTGTKSAILLSILAKDSGKRLKVYSAEFTKTRKEDSEKRVLTLFSANESIVTKDNESCRTDAAWNADSSVSFTTKNPDKNGGMRFYVDGVKKEAVNLKEYRYFKFTASFFTPST